MRDINKRKLNKLIAIWQILTHKCYYVATCKTGMNNDTMNQVSFMTKGMANTIAHNLTDIIVQDEMQDNAVNEAMNILNGIK
jgi:hypothetical protein